MKLKRKVFVKSSQGAMRYRSEKRKSDDYNILHRRNKVVIT